MPKSRWATIIIDCQTDEPDAAAAFWSEALGWASEKRPDPGNSNYRQRVTRPVR